MLKNQNNYLFQIYIIEIFIIMMLLSLAQRTLFRFAKWSKPKPKPNRQRQVKKSFAVSDDKAAKLSKSQQEQQNKAKFLQLEKMVEQTKRKVDLYRHHDKSLEQYMSPQQMENVYIKQLLYLKGISKRRKLRKTTQQQKKLTQEQVTYLPTQKTVLNPKNDKYQQVKIKCGNFTNIINSKYQLQKFQGNQNLRRVGALGIKLGMTTSWDRWGHVVPTTVIQLDRTQIVQIKKPVRNNQLWQVQVGVGQKRLKKVTKPMLGHYLKARVPPKRKLAQFKVSQQCLLPVGYMISARHYTPGMYVDVIGKTVGHGFQGTIKRYGFKRQPATHGNSLTTRVLGSTGGRQDPGRVFKQKKMYGHMGGKQVVQRGLPVFKIDVEKNLLFLRGSIPGKAGTIVRVRDTLLYDKAVKNLDLSHFPTFIEQPGKQYSKQLSMYCGQRDPDEIQIHDNAFIVDDGEVQQATTTKDTIPQD